MTAPPLPVADAAPTGPGPLLAGPATPGATAGDVPNASEFAALLQEAGVAAEGQAGDERIETRPDAPTDGASVEPAPPSAFESLLFLAALNPPSSAALARQRALAAPGPGGIAASAAAATPSTGTLAHNGAASLPVIGGDAEDADLAGGPTVQGGGARFLAASTDAEPRTQRRPSAGTQVGADGAPGSGVWDRRFTPALERSSAFAEASAHKAEPSVIEARSAAFAPGPESTLVAAPATSLARPPAAIEIATPVHDPAWRAEAMGRIASLVTRGIDHAELRLSPAELGPVEVRIDLRGGEATLAIVATQPATRDALEQALPLLREMLSQQGLSLGEASVRDGRADGGANRDGGGAPRAGHATRFDALASQSPAAPRATLLRRLVDVFA